jgi:hypothetical protein
VVVEEHRVHCHVAARELERSGGDTAAASRLIASMIAEQNPSLRAVSAASV